MRAPRQERATNSSLVPIPTEHFKPFRDRAVPTISVACRHCGVQPQEHCRNVDGPVPSHRIRRADALALVRDQPADEPLALPEGVVMCSGCGRYVSLRANGELRAHQTKHRGGFKCYQVTYDAPAETRSEEG